MVGTSVVTYSTANGTAVAPDDYAAINGGTVTFSPGDSVKTIAVQVIADTLAEPDETFSLNITGISDGIIVRGSGLGTINDDEPPPLTGTEGDVVDGNGGPVGDGLILANDVSVIRQFILGTATPVTTPNQFQRSDVNLPCGNGQIDSGDVTVIRQIILGTIPASSGCGPTTTARPSDAQKLNPIWLLNDVTWLISSTSAPLCNDRFTLECSIHGANGRTVQF